MKSFVVCAATVFYGSLNAQIIFQEDFETGTLNPDFWEAIPSVEGENGLVEVMLYDNLPSAPPTDGFWGLAMGKDNESATSTINAVNLTLDLMGYDNLWLSFMIRDVLDEGQYADGLYLLSTPESNPVKILDFATEIWPNAWGRYAPVPLTKLAIEHGVVLTEQTIIQFRQMGEGDFGSGEDDGIIMDDLIVWNQVIEYGSLPYIEGFEENIAATDLNPMGAYNHTWQAWPSETLGTELAAYIQPSGSYRLNNQASFEGIRGLELSRNYDSSGNSIVAHDIYLNFEAGDQALMSFMMSDRRTNENSQNGIFLSVDGGQTWSLTAIYAFNTSEIGDWAWNEVSFDLASSANDQNMTLSPTTVVRIQEIGPDNTNGSNTLPNDDETDGFWIDNISIQTAYEIEEDVQICSGATYELPSGVEVEAEGSYESPFLAANGLDSLVITNLTFYEDQSSTEEITICEGESIILPDMTEVSAEGEYPSFLVDENNCNYTLLTDLTVIGADDLSVSENSQILSAEFDGQASYQWIDCDSEEEILGANLEDFEPGQTGNFQVEAFNGQCTVLSECFAFTFVGIEEVLSKQVKLYPNPTSGKVWVDGIESGSLILITDLTGKVVLQTIWHPTESINISDFESGHYFLNVKNKNENTVIHFVKAD